MGRDKDFNVGTIDALSYRVGAPIVVTDASTYSLKQKNSGRLHILPDLSQACTISLPSEVAGLTYKFSYGGAAEDAHGIVLDSGSDTNYFIGGVTHLDDDAGAAGIEVVSVYSDNDSNSILNATTVGAGTIIEVTCDGTNWYLTGLIVGVTAPTFGDQA